MSKLNLSKFSKGSSPQKVLKEESRKLVHKWESTGLLNELDSEQEVHGLAVLLENQYNQLVREATRTSTSAGNEEWSGVALPIVRRLFGEIVSKEFLSVQPMNMPSGLIFYLDFVYGNNQPGFNRGENVHGNVETPGDPQGGLYGAGRFGYSINDIETEANVESVTLLQGQGGLVSRLGGDAMFVDTQTGELTDIPIGETEGGGPAPTTQQLAEIQVSSLVEPDLEGVRAFTVGHSDINMFFPRHTDRAAGAAQVSFIVLLENAAIDDTDPANLVYKGDLGDSTNNTVTVTYHRQPTAGDRGDFESGFRQNDTFDPNSTDPNDPDKPYGVTPNQNIGGGEEHGPTSLKGTDPLNSGNIPDYQILDVPEIEFDIKQKSLVSKTRRMKSIWTPELSQDMAAYHQIDAQEELTSMLSEYVSMEIDAELLDMLIQNALTTEYWSAIPGREWNSTTGTFEDVGSHTGTKLEWYETLGSKIQKVSNRIYQKTMRGDANFVVCSPTIATALESIAGFKADTGGDQTQFAMGVQRIGTMYNRLQVYKNPYMLENVMLVGFRGDNFLDTGAVYAPYIPLIMTPVIYDSNNMTPRQGVQTRYAKSMVRPEYFSRIIIADVDAI